MKLVSFAILFAGAVQATLTAKQAGLIMEGIFIGATETDAPQIGTCFTDVVSMGKDIEGAVQSFEKKSAEGVKEGIMDLGKAVKETSIAIKDCKQAPEDIKKIEHMAAYFSNPETVVYHIGKDLLVNGRDIYHEVKDAIVDYKAGDYKGFGVNVGEALARTVIGHPPRLQSVAQNAKLIFEGVLIGAVEAELPDLYKCVIAGDKMYKDMQGAASDLNRRGRRIRGIKSAGKAIGQYIKLGEKCPKIPKDFSKLFKKLDKMALAFTDPETAVEHIAKDVIVNGRSIIKEIIDAVRDWRSRKYKDFGKELGEALAKVFIGKEGVVAPKVKMITN